MLRHEGDSLRQVVVCPPERVYEERSIHPGSFSTSWMDNNKLMPYYIGAFKALTGQRLRHSPHLAQRSS